MTVAAQIIPIPLANRPTTQEQPTMATTDITPGAQLRITLPVTVQHTQNGQLTLTTGAVIDPTAPDIHIAVIEPGFQTGDSAVLDGGELAHRIIPSDGRGYWITTDGRQFYDDVTDPARLQVIARRGQGQTPQQQPAEPQMETQP